MRMPLVDRFRPDPTVSKKRAFYNQPSSVKLDLMPLYQKVANALDVKPTGVRALAIVESNEKPLTEGGWPVVRFEKAYWQKYRVDGDKAQAAFDKAINARDLDARWQQFLQMCEVNETAAILSHSFGVFQVMGFNYKACLCADPIAFLKEMLTIEGQFKMLERFVKMNPPLLAALRKQDPQKVALHFNGKRYAVNKYDVRWAAASKAGGERVWA